MVLSVLALALTAHAQEPADEPEADEPDEVGAPPAAAPTVGRTRNYLMEVNARGRYLWTPKGLIDVWYFRHDGAGDTTPERPNLAAYATGLEYVVKSRQANGIFYVEYIGLLVDEVHQVYRLAEDEIEPAGVLGGEQPAHILGIGRPKAGQQSVRGEVPKSGELVLVLLDLKPVVEVT